MSESEVPATSGAAPEGPKAEAPVEEAKAKKSPKGLPFKVGERGWLDKGRRKHVRLVTEEEDPLYNPKVKEPPPEHLHEDLARLKWKETNPLAILPDGRIWSGRTKWRVLEKAEKLLGEEIKVPFVVVDIDEDEAADATDALDMQVQKLNPMVVAEKIMRALSRGKTPQEILVSTGLKPEQQDGYLLLMDEDLCPPAVQELLREDKISMAAATELARKAGSMTKSELVNEAERIAKLASAGVKVTAAKVKHQSGDEKVATQKECKQFILDLQSDSYGGKFDEIVRYAAIVGLEVKLGTRSIRSAEGVLKNLAHGKVPKINFKQYGDGKGGKDEEKPE